MTFVARVVTKKEVVHPTNENTRAEEEALL